jgi:uncharacterized protein (TIGR03067 family)
MSTNEMTEILARPAGRRRILLLAALTFGVGLAWLSGPATADDKDATANESLKAIQGTWVSDESNGFDSTWTFSGDELKSTINGTEYVCKVTADPDAKPHPTADFMIKDGPDEAKGQTAKAIYKRDGEKLILCVAHPGGERPQDFEPADEVFLFELKKKN